MTRICTSATRAAAWSAALSRGIDGFANGRGGASSSTRDVTDATATCFAAGAGNVMSVTSRDFGAGPAMLVRGPWFTATIHAPTSRAVATSETIPTAMLRRVRAGTFHHRAVRTRRDPGGKLGASGLLDLRDGFDSLAGGAIAAFGSPLGACRQNATRGRRAAATVGASR